jgi:hypothetical protein
MKFLVIIVVVLLLIFSPQIIDWLRDYFNDDSWPGVA